MEKEGKHSRPHPAFFFLELICNVWFTVEFFIRIFFTPNKISFIRYIEVRDVSLTVSFREPVNIIDLIATLFFYIDWALETFLTGSNRDSVEFFSIIRILRLFKLTQHSVGLKILIQTFKASAQVIHSNIQDYDRLSSLGIISSRILRSSGNCYLCCSRLLRRKIGWESE